MSSCENTKLCDYWYLRGQQAERRNLFERLEKLAQWNAVSVLAATLAQDQERILNNASEVK